MSEIQGAHGNVEFERLPSLPRVPSATINHSSDITENGDRAKLDGAVNSVSLNLA